MISPGHGGGTGAGVGGVQAQVGPRGHQEVVLSPKPSLQPPGTGGCGEERGHGEQQRHGGRGEGGGGQQPRAGPTPGRGSCSLGLGHPQGRRILDSGSMNCSSEAHRYRKFRYLSPNEKFSVLEETEN